MLGERRSAILESVINYYIETGEPIGSKTLCQMLPYAISPATVRNEMAFLTSIGFLEQRHTSGGRVPTKLSYRYYIDNLLKAYPVSDFEKEKINAALSTNASDPERLLADASRLLSDVTGCAAFYSILKDPYDCVQGVELIPAGNGKVMLVVMTTGGKIKSSVCRLNCPADAEFKKLFYKITQENFIGTALEEVNLSLIQSVAPTVGEKIFDLLPALSTICALCAEAAKGVLVISGETKLLSQSELGNSVYNLLLLLAQKEKLTVLLDKFALSNLNAKIYIGDENPLYELRNTAMAIAKMQFNETQIATLGIIGSLRINYAQILPKVDYIIGAVSKLLLEGGVKYE